MEISFENLYVDIGTQRDNMEDNSVLHAISKLRYV